MEVWIPFVVIILLLTSSRKANTGRRWDLGFVVVMLSLAMLILQLQPHG